MMVVRNLIGMMSNDFLGKLQWFICWGVKEFHPKHTYYRLVCHMMVRAVVTNL
jgi:hypothetical protein